MRRGKWGSMRVDKEAGDRFCRTLWALIKTLDFYPKHSGKPLNILKSGMEHFCNFKRPFCL